MNCKQLLFKKWKPKPDYLKKTKIKTKKPKEKENGKVCLRAME